MIKQIMQYNSILDGAMEVANHLKNSTMEAENQVKHGASSKSLTSRVNFFRKACFAFLLTGFLLGGCDLENFVAPGSNDGLKQLSVSITGEKYNAMIDEVKLMIDEHEVLATATYNDGSFTFDLPDNVATGYLYGIREWFYISEEVTINNSNVLTATPYIVAFKDGSPVGSIYNRGNDSRGYLVYFSSELTITGKYTETWDRDITDIDEDIYEYSINAKRGWNMIYSTWSDDTENVETGIKYVSTFKTTTTSPTGMGWVIELDGGGYYGSAVTAGEELTITAAQVENASSVKRVLAGNYDRGIAAGAFETGGFSLTLPNKAYPGANIEQGQQLHGWFGGGTNNLTISNESARLERIDYFEGYSSQNGAWSWSAYLVDFKHGKFDGNSATIVWYIFASADVEVSRSGSSVNYSMDLKAGWNTVYETRTASNTTISTEPVSDLKWYVEDDFLSPFSVKRTTKSLNSRRVNSRMFGW